MYSRPLWHYKPSPLIAVSSKYLYAQVQPHRTASMAVDSQSCWGTVQPWRKPLSCGIDHECEVQNRQCIQYIFIDMSCTLPPHTITQHPPAVKDHENTEGQLRHNYDNVWETHLFGVVVCSEGKNKPCFGARRMSFVERFSTQCHSDLAIVHCSLSYSAIFKSQLVNQHALSLTFISYLSFSYFQDIHETVLLTQSKLFPASTDT